MTEELLPHFIEADQFSAVFKTEELLAQDELPFSTIYVKKDEFIFMPGEKHNYTYHIVSGLVKLYLTSVDGTMKTLCFHGPGTQFAFQGFEEGRHTMSTAVAVTDCEILVIHYDDLLEYCNKHTDCYLAWIVYLKQVVNSLTLEIANLSFETGVRRLASLLYSLSQGAGPSVSLTIDDLAEIIGTHRNTVSNSLAYLRERGLVEVKPRPIVVKDIEGLRSYLDDGSHR